MKLLLINKDNSLPENYKPLLKELGNGCFLETNTAIAMKKMLYTANACGIRLRVFSAYRSISYQKGLFDESVESNMKSGMSHVEAYEKTAMSIAPPGQSEHNAGVAADITSVCWEGEITEEFDKTPEFSWLYNNAHCFGFILRYPKDKTDITGYIYEPWHYRYVGEAHAKCIKKMNITLEEYLQRHGLCVDSVNK